MKESLKIDTTKHAHWEYDEEVDVLYISFGKPKEALTMDVDSGILVRYDKESRKMVGFTITGLKTILLGRAA